MNPYEFDSYTDIVYRDTPLPPSAKQREVREDAPPERIREMKRLYQYGSNSFQQKCRNFYRQGKFMEDYEDDFSWHGEYKQYFTTYHDLTLKQLRGYFTWRTLIRRGEFHPITTSFAYMYLYELLNGIGAGSAMESLRKMEEFKVGYLDSGIGDPGMEKNLNRWMFEFSVLHHVPLETAKKYADPESDKRDQALIVLRSPADHSDEDVFAALNYFTGSKLESSPVLLTDEPRGKHLFSEIWRAASKHVNKNGSDFFTACFGTQKVYPWRPLANAVYLERQRLDEADYILNECRSYRCRNGAWREEKYEKLFFDRKLFLGLLHEADCKLRRSLQTGHYLREKPENAWADPVIDLVIEEDRKAQIEAARPKIRIDLSGLDQIRKDAAVTRNSLLVEEEADEFLTFDDEEPLYLPPEDQAGSEEPDTMAIEPEPVFDLDPLYVQILWSLLRDESPDEIIKERHLMPSIIADTVNEAFYDEIGDMILECDGDTLTLVEDYIEDIRQILEGDHS